MMKRVLTVSLAYQTFQKLSFQKQVNCLRLASHTNIPVIWGNFSSQCSVLKKKNSGIQLWKNVDSLHFKCNFNVPNFTIVALITSHQTKQLRIQENLQFEDSVFLEAER